MIALFKGIFQSMPSFIGDHPVLFWGALAITVALTIHTVSNVRTILKNAEYEGNLGTHLVVWNFIKYFLCIICLVEADYVAASGNFKN